MGNGKITRRVLPRMRQVEVREACPCGGRLIYQNIVLTSNPPWFPHRCDKCGTVTNRRTRAEWIEEEIDPDFNEGGKKC